MSEHEPGNDKRTKDRSLGLATDELRRHNLAVVLERLHLMGAVSRSELTSTTGLNRSTIGGLIGQLTGLGLVTEGPGLLTPGPGRPSPVVTARPEGAVVVAIDLAVDSIAVASVGLGGHIFNRFRVARPRGRFSPQETVAQVARLAGPLLESLPDDHLLVGVGAAIVGVTRRLDGFVHIAPNLGWHNVPLGAMLASELDLPGHVQVANDADLGALAEQRRGVGLGVAHLIYVHGEVGIGTGIILNGAPLLGSAGYAGEAGHMLINPEGGKCRCGRSGCWETEAGEGALARHARLPHGLTGLAALDTVMARAAEADQSTTAAIAEVGKWLGFGLGNLINIFNPELVVLGGFYQRLFPYLEEAVGESARARALEAPGRTARIVPSGLGFDAPLIGAAELALSAVIDDPAAVGDRAMSRRKSAGAPARA